ncbi:cilia- and flagella-associated protein 45-like [Lingula anatina]|uniref:Cilia- and flagella-associated protein 45 n=1 Tax=Lingula anatina TaxID=7574 RepID=A0A1S3JPL4_LINAN|nr:cilia- and flagella-associated protein 45-like [Lingula anatina]|eukprot:XP_013412315.1 cilia- and flagella-associated protein 45-like [Lingula anatina]
MPGSAISAATHSSASSASRRAKTKNYRVVSYTSQVDESLFGTPNKAAQRDLKGYSDGNDYLFQESEPRSAKKKSSGKNKKETVQVITKDLIRNLIVPKEDPSGVSIILEGYDFNRIKNASIVMTQEQKMAELERIKREKEMAQEEATARKQMMKTMDINRQKNGKLNDLEQEAKEKAEHLLEKANLQRQEQEDEIKHLNELILNAKCHAIRDAQVLEKGHIKTEMEEEEKRLDMMMEVERVNAIAMQEEIEKRRKEEKLLGAAKVLEQIQDNDQERLFELERKDQENIQMQKYLRKLMEEDEQKLEKKHAEAAALREELNRANADMLQRKELQAEQEKLAELKVVEYQKQKAEREAAFEREQERIRIEKEKETARMRALQERARDEQAERDALRAKRAQEQAEREWRAKEAMEQRKKVETETMLKVARAKQMDQKEHFLAVQAQRERAEFERVLRAQKELVEKEKRLEVEGMKKRYRHADDVRLQIREKEEEKINARNAFFEEGVKLDEEARQRRQKLDEIKKKKLDDLRSLGIHDKYIAGVERKINQPQHISA